MASSKKSIKLSKFGLNANKKKTGINLWRCFFNGTEKSTGAEATFFIEVELLNPWISPTEAMLGFAPRVTIKEEDLQYALAGTESAQGIQSERIVQPSYIVVRAGKLGSEPKQVCAYHSMKSLKYTVKPFSLSVGNKLFTEEKITGFINITEGEIINHPEYLCENGFVSWDLNYDILKDYSEGYSNKTDRWFPFGMKTAFSGTFSIDGDEYIVEPKKSYGYMDRYWGKSLPDVWFHISSSNLQSIISGKTLFDTAFSIQGAFDDKVSFVGNFEGSDISFCADSPDRKYTAVWNCVQTPENEDKDENKLHWSVSINSKIWVIDVDLYCKLSDLYNRSIETPDGDRKVLNVLQSGTAVGEIKLFKRVKRTLEQIEYAKIVKANCEFGHTEEGEI